jgi:hypothetical protein
LATAKTLTIALNVNANAAPAAVVRNKVRTNMKNFSTDLCSPVEQMNKLINVIYCNYDRLY